MPKKKKNYKVLTLIIKIDVAKVVVPLKGTSVQNIALYFYCLNVFLRSKTKKKQKKQLGHELTTVSK